MKETTLEKRLVCLYQLQQIDQELQFIRELKGDLPEIVENLERQIAESKAKVKELNEVLKQLKKERDEADAEIISLMEKIEKYKSQQLQVKSNKQYDALSREIDMATEKVSQLEKEMELSEGKMQTTKTDIEKLSASIEELLGEYEERAKELKEVNKEHEKEETRFVQQREKLVSKIEKSDLERYERIRKAKGGKAVVPVKRNACGGCFNRIPPQKILELRRNSKLYTCEQCGRILVSDEIVAISQTVEL
jgi:predicted  nucleic acid-binding Zn-ribbon protein